MKRRDLKILVVDDEKVLTDSMVQVLRTEGFVAMGAYSGGTALEDAERWRPDLILMDVLLPDANGIEIAVAMRRKLPESRILLMSGQAATVDLLERAREQGQEFEVLAKPFAPDYLLRRVGALRAA